MRFCDFAQLLKQHYAAKSQDDFVKTLFDSAMDDRSLDSDCEQNPLYKLKPTTLYRYYSGELPISKQNASAINGRFSEKAFTRFMKLFSDDALLSIRDGLAGHGFDVPVKEVPRACANILAQIIKLRADNRPDNVTSLNYSRLDSKKLLKNIAPPTIEHRRDKLHIAQETINILQIPVPDKSARHEEKYIMALCEAFAERLQRIAVKEKDIPSLKAPYPTIFKDQRMAYYSALSVERSVRDVFDDGENEFELLKKETWGGINMTFWRNYSDGVERLLAVLSKAVDIDLGASVFCRMKNLIGCTERKGICHILVNDGTIKSWVSADE